MPGRTWPTPKPGTCPNPPRAMPPPRCAPPATPAPGCAPPAAPIRCANSAGVAPTRTRTSTHRMACFMVVPQPAEYSNRIASVGLGQGGKNPIHAAIIIGLHRSRQIKLRKRHLARVPGREVVKRIANNGVILNFKPVAITENEYARVFRLGGLAGGSRSRWSWRSIRRGACRVSGDRHRAGVRLFGGYLPQRATLKNRWPRNHGRIVGLLVVLIRGGLVHGIGVHYNRHWDINRVGATKKIIRMAMVVVEAVAEVDVVGPRNRQRGRHPDRSGPGKCRRRRGRNTNWGGHHASMASR